MVFILLLSDFQLLNVIFLQRTKWRTFFTTITFQGSWFFLSDISLQKTGNEKLSIDYIQHM